VELKYLSRWRHRWDCRHNNLRLRSVSSSTSNKWKQRKEGKRGKRAGVNGAGHYISIEIIAITRQDRVVVSGAPQFPQLSPKKALKIEVNFSMCWCEMAIARGARVEEGLTLQIGRTRLTGRNISLSNSLTKWEITWKGLGCIHRVGYFCFQRNDPCLFLRSYTFQSSA